MTADGEGYYRVRPGTEVIRLASDAILLQGDTYSFRIDGSFVAVLTSHILPLLDGRRSLREVVSAVPGASDDVLIARLNELVKANVIERQDRPWDEDTTDPGPSQLIHLLSTLGISRGEVSQRLAQLRVGIFGLEGTGAALAWVLAKLSIGALRLIDPFPYKKGDNLWIADATASDLGRPRHDVIQQALVARSGRTTITTLREAVLSREAVLREVDEVDVLVGCFDRGFERCHDWLNRAAIQTMKPAVFAEVRGHLARVGPFVLPTRTPCYMCFRMRRVACNANFEEAMAYERSLNQSDSPTPDSRASLPVLGPWSASMLALELVKYAVADIPPTLAGKVLQFDAFSFAVETHHILQQPECPTCADREAQRMRFQPGLAGLRESEGVRGDIAAARVALVSEVTGVVRSCERFAKDDAEPPLPIIVRADVGNHRLGNNHRPSSEICSGKGLTLDAARGSALGEAIERYSAAFHSPDEITYAPRSALDDTALDPSLLVLYLEEQYAALPYARYRDNVLGWIPSKSLVYEREVYVPAIAVFMDYHARSQDEFICPTTSNGLAAGATLLEAVLSATMEVIERDAFMITWLNQLTPKRFLLESHPDPGVVHLYEAYARRGVELRVYQCPTDSPCAVFAAVALQREPGEGPAAVFGLGADLDAARAARKAVLEVGQVRPALRRRLRGADERRRLAELVEDPRRVATLDDHDLLYASNEMMPALDFFLEGLGEHFEGANSERQAADSLNLLVTYFESRSQDLLYVNLTTPDMRALGLHTARAILPRYQPIDFGWKERRLAGFRLYDLPMELGLRSSVGTASGVNINPHPLA